MHRSTIYSGLKIKNGQEFPAAYGVLMYNIQRYRKQLFDLIKKKKEGQQVTVIQSNIRFFADRHRNGFEVSDIPHEYYECCMACDHTIAECTIQDGKYIDSQGQTIGTVKTIYSIEAESAVTLIAWYNHMNRRSQAMRPFKSFQLMGKEIEEAGFEEESSHTDQQTSGPSNDIEQAANQPARPQVDSSTFETLQPSISDYIRTAMNNAQNGIQADERSTPGAFHYTMPRTNTINFRPDYFEPNPELEL